MAKQQLTLERETYTGRDGNEYFGYIVRGVLRGREVKADIVPKDIGGYELLDILFDGEGEVLLTVTDEEKVDSFGNKTRYKSYVAETIDEDGTPLVCEVKPKESSDKCYITAFLNQAKRTADDEQE